MINQEALDFTSFGLLGTLICEGYFVLTNGNDLKIYEIHFMGGVYDARSNRDFIN